MRISRERGSLGHAGGEAEGRWGPQGRVPPHTRPAPTHVSANM